MWMSQRGHSGDRCVLASTLCKYDLRKGDLFVLSCSDCVGVCGKNSVFLKPWSVEVCCVFV